MSATTLPIDGKSTTPANRWRRRRMCALVTSEVAPGCLRSVSARGAFLETNARPMLGGDATLHHPDAGAIDATVVGHDADGVRLAFAYDAGSVAFALGVIAADLMPTPSAQR